MGETEVFDGTERERERERRKNILAIDDHQGILDAIQVIFEDHHNVFTARDGMEGLSLLNKVRIDLVLLDMKLPRMDGVEVLRRIRGVSKKLPVIVITAHTTAERAEQCLNLRAHAYIRKPFDNDELLDTATEILRENGNAEDVAFRDSKSHAAGRVSSRVQDAIKFIDDNCTTSIRPRDVAKEVDLSRKYLGRKVMKETGHSINYHINWKKIQKAKELLLQNRDAALSEISNKLGFNSEDHFQRTFKNITGKTPGGFRKGEDGS